MLEKFSNKKKTKIDTPSDHDIVRSTLIKRAQGFVISEITEEFCGEEDSNLKLVKRKVTTKEVAPDINALKVLIEMQGPSDNKYHDMTDSELKAEKDRLLKLLKEEDGNEN